MDKLIKIIEEKDCRAIAIVGMTKNVGKTVTLNRLIAEFEKKRLTTGLVSAGYDGERFDRLTLKEKPRIYAPQGAYAATAGACFEAAEAELVLIETSDLSTPLGLIIIAGVKAGGLIELAGPGSVSGLKKLTARMFALGAEYILVDGAINRMASASPQVTDGTILATGASLGPTMEDVVKKTAFRLKLMETPTVSEALLLKVAKKGLAEGSAAVVYRSGDTYRVEAIKAAIPLLAVRQALAKFSKETAAFVFGGALVDDIITELMKLTPNPPPVIVKDATKLFLTPGTFSRFTDRGGRIMAINRLNLLAVTINPTDPSGRDYNPDIFLARMTEALSPCPVFDLVLEGKLKDQ